jgi:CBS domain-containing protein
MQARQVTLNHVYRCQDTDTALHAATLMRDARIGFVVVVDAHARVVGVVTDRDLTLRVVAEHRSLQTPLREVMTRKPLVTFSLNEDLTTIAERMAKSRKWRAVALDDRGQCEGVLSLADIAQFEPPERVGAFVCKVTGREAASPERRVEGL